MQDTFAHCEALVRAADKDRFLATLFAPAERRGPLFALYAFNGEIARVREVVREPLAGEIRLQWWRDAINGLARGDADANPVAAALLAVVRDYGLPSQALLDLIDAHRFDLYSEPMQSLAELETYGRDTAGGLMALSAHVLNGGEDPALRPITRHAGGRARHSWFAAGAASPCRARPIVLPLEVLRRHGAAVEDVNARHATPELRAALAELRAVARQHLEATRQLLTGAPPAVLPALLPLALVRPMLDRMERADDDPFAPPVLPQWRRQWRLWRAARRGLARSL